MTRQATAEHPHPAPSARAAVAARGVSKAFRLPHEAHSSLKHRALHPLARSRFEVLPALHDVSVDIAEGETFGIVGRNGSGKSTLLKCLSGIYRLDSGRVEVQGRLAPFIELGVGFNLELTARDNAIAAAVLLGLSPAEARSRLDAVLAFAELEQFADMKLKNFSSGMTVRLAFAVTVQVDAEVLLFDEVLTVGDEAFQAKCLSHFERLKEQERTVLLVTHDMEAVERHCDRAMLLNEGRVVEVGEPADVARAYHAVNEGRFAPRPVVDRADAARDPSRPAPHSWRSVRAVLGTDPRRLPTLTRTLAAAQFKVKYLDAKLSYLWVIMGPLALFGILYFVFTRVGSFDKGVAHYPLYLLSGLVLWMYFAEATSTAVISLVQNESLLRRLPFPKLAVPLSVVAMALFDLCMSALTVLAFILAAGIAPRLAWLEVIPLILFLTLLVIGVSMLLSALFVRYRDVDHVWALVRQALFYASPILYVATAVPESLKPFALANPLAAVFTQFRHAVIDPAAPTYIDAAGGVARALIPLAITIGLFAAGLWVFSRESPTVAENL
ncbi:MAG: type transport system ATP-binding protein [Thermoleophilaceae bacterium]|nr:type transport system ATP-binding protein [Thermoleophilaceae bacterium]